MLKDFHPKNTFTRAVCWDIWHNGKADNIIDFIINLSDFPAVIFPKEKLHVKMLEKIDI